MPNKSLRDVLMILLPAVLLVIGTFWLASRYVKPAPPSEIKISTGSKTGAYHRFAERYRNNLAKSGVTVHLQPSAGSVENLKRLSDAKSQSDLALIQGGVGNSETAPDLLSLGRMFMEPVWVFYKSSTGIDRLVDLRGKRIAVGPQGSGTRELAVALLEPNGITLTTATLKDIGGDDAAACLRQDECDAIFLVASPESKVVQSLFRDSSIRLMSFRQAEALTRIFPFLAHVVLPHGVIDFVADIPRQDTHLVAAQAALVVRSDIHPAIVGLLVQAAREVHQPGGLFQKIGEFPKDADPEYPMSDAAEIAYNSGVPLLQRLLPFWLAIFLERMIVLIVPIATILLPLIKLGPMLYEWRVRRRLLYWYGQLKDLERRMKADTADEHRQTHIQDVAEIDHEVSEISVPLRFSDQFYELRAAIDLVRQRLAAAAGAK
jgi:TRAP transporter TAXI family solute receptor